MSIASANPSRVNKVSRPQSLLDNLAKNAVMQILGKLPAGSLTIEDQGELYEFGGVEGCDGIRAKIVIRDPSAWRDIALGGSIGAGEAFMAGSWDSPNLVALIRLMAANVDMLNAFDGSRSLIKRLVERLLHRFNANTLRGSRKNIAAHYDLGNDFFRLFLDPSMMYSSAIFPGPQTSLEQASIHKLQTVCEKLALTPEDHLLEIGTGWGGLAIYAAQHFGCRVTTTTISREQYDYARQAVANAGLESRVSVLLEDYRNLDGQYDKLVSIEMIEAVGHEYYGQYFERCCRLLVPHGLMLIQAITIPHRRYEAAKNSVDFIQRYIFPGGGLPSIEVIEQCIAERTDMHVVHIQDIGLDYARTLQVWRQRFLANIESVRVMGFDEVFCRMWEFYLCYCEGGFLERAISTAQIVFARPGIGDASPAR